MRHEGVPAEEPMLRALTWPLAPTVLMLIAGAALLLAVLEGSLFGLPGLLILASFTSKYAYVLLESAANGLAEPPTLATEMVSPFEQRPLIQLGIGLLVGGLIAWLPPLPRAAVAALALLLLPASIGVLGASDRALEAVNPLVLLRTMVALGPWYPFILAVTALYALVIYWAWTAPAWGVIRWALSLACLLSLFTLIGSLFHRRRLQLGFEPIHSPERTAERAAAVQRRAAGQFLEELYGGIRLHDYARAGELLEAWSARTDDAAVARDAPAMVQSALQWNDARGLALVASRLAARLLRAGNNAVALDVVAAALPRAPVLRMASDAEQFALAQAARADGRRALVVALLARFEQDFPASRFLARALALRAEYAPLRR
jgi:hypothetical protein